QDLHAYPTRRSSDLGNRREDRISCSNPKRDGSTRSWRAYPTRRSEATACHMACKLIWSPAARDDLRDIVRLCFVARSGGVWRFRSEEHTSELQSRFD